MTLNSEYLTNPEPRTPNPEPRTPNPEPSAKAYTPDAALDIQKKAREARIDPEKTHEIPDVAIRNDDNLLIASVHRRNEEADIPRSRAVWNTIKNWLEETRSEGKNRVVLVEGSLDKDWEEFKRSLPTGQEFEEVRKRGEFAIARYLAEEHSVPVESLEEPKEDLQKHLMKKGFKAEEVFTHDAFLTFPSLWRDPKYLDPQWRDPDTGLDVFHWVVHRRQVTLDLDPEKTIGAQRDPAKIFMETLRKIYPNGPREDRFYPTDITVPEFRKGKPLFPDGKFDLGLEDEPWMSAEASNIGLLLSPEKRSELLNEGNTIEKIGAAMQDRRNEVDINKTNQHTAVGRKVLHISGGMHAKDNFPQLEAFASGSTAAVLTPVPQ